MSFAQTIWDRLRISAEAGRVERFDAYLADGGQGLKSKCNLKVQFCLSLQTKTAKRQDESPPQGCKSVNLNEIVELRGVA